MYETLKPSIEEMIAIRDKDYTTYNIPLYEYCTYMLFHRYLYRFKYSSN